MSSPAAPGLTRWLPALRPRVVHPNRFLVLGEIWIELGYRRELGWNFIELIDIVVDTVASSWSWGLQILRVG